MLITASSCTPKLIALTFKPIHVRRTFNGHIVAHCTHVTLHHACRSRIFVIAVRYRLNIEHYRTTSRSYGHIANVALTSHAIIESHRYIVVSGPPSIEATLSQRLRSYSHRHHRKTVRDSPPDGLSVLPI